ncbi:MAG: methylaspartate mutase accessory protein GlmL, partial [Deltaproteobacteria bacterium]
MRSVSQNDNDPMISLAILIDFGSTFTKVTAVNLTHAQVIGRSQAPSTVLSDVREGLLRALISLQRRCDLFKFPPEDLSVLDGKVVLASSSAAGGLRIAVIGLVPGLTVEAANQAALGAGAKVVGSTAFKLSENAIQSIKDLRPDIILLTGGTDGGDFGTILYNARVLAQSSLSMPIVVAGNRAAAQEVCQLLKSGRKEVRMADNVMPRSGTLAVESAREEIRKLFMERITHAKGLDLMEEFVPVVLPTPMAVLEGIKLGADGLKTETGSETEKGWGEMLVVDVGGATTDVHSIGYGYPAGENVIGRGLAEPYAKRTVEGDLGIRFNAETIVARVGLKRLAGTLRADFPEHPVSDDNFRDYIEKISHCTESVPLASWHAVADAVLARAAVDLAVERHVGRRERIVAREGEAWVHYGKDLRETPILIGTGGVFVHNPFAGYILSQRAPSNNAVQSLRPKNPQMFLDSSYLLYAVGLLAKDYANVALRIFKTCMTPPQPRNLG